MSESHSGNEGGEVKKAVRVYIAGPYTGGDVCENVSDAMSAWHDLADLGFYPFCPHLTHFLHLKRQRPYAEWLAFDQEWLRACHAVLRLPGKSPGADREIVEANRLGIPVFNSIGKLLEHFK